MCLVKTPKLPPGEKPKEPTIIRNKYLDGVGPAANAQRQGRSSLRIMRGTGITPSAPPTATSTPSPALMAAPGTSPVSGGGGRPTSGLRINAY